MTRTGGIWLKYTLYMRDELGIVHCCHGKQVLNLEVLSAEMNVVTKAGKIIQLF